MSSEDAYLPNEEIHAFSILHCGYVAHYWFVNKVRSARISRICLVVDLWCGWVYKKIDQLQI